jgi:hypothetical protein
MLDLECPLLALVTECFWGCFFLWEMDRFLHKRSMLRVINVIQVPGSQCWLDINGWSRHWPKENRQGVGHFCLCPCGFIQFIYSQIQGQGQAVLITSRYSHLLLELQSHQGNSCIYFSKGLTQCLHCRHSVMSNKLINVTPLCDSGHSSESWGFRAISATPWKTLSPGRLHCTAQHPLQRTRGSARSPFHMPAGPPRCL